MNDDTELIRRYLEERSEDAFSELVRRHIALVYATALRRLGGDTHLAEDVAQKVFVDLARKARGLLGRGSVAGWAYVAACRGSAEAVRKEQRRKAREEKIHAMQTILSLSPQATEPDWSRLRLLLDEIILELRAEDRDAVILRFFGQLTFAQVGAALKLSEEAARKRVERAVEKLRMKLQQRGVASTSGALMAGLAGEAGVAVPVALTAKVTGAALAQMSGLGAVTSWLVSFTNSLVSGGAVCAAVGLGLVAVSSQRHLNADLRGEIAHGETQLRAIHELQSENLRLGRLEAQAAGLRGAAAELPALRAKVSASASEPSAVWPVAVATPQEVTVTESNTIMWGQDHVNLEQFLERLRIHPSQHPGEAGQVVVRGKPGADFAAVAYVIEEASKVSLTNIAIDSSATPGPADNWFQRRTNRGVAPPTNGP